MLERLGGCQDGLTRGEKARKIRESLLASATKVVGQRGYASAMISEITSRAGVAQGTFYNYFESRQDLFDQLLPSIGGEMLDYIRQEASGARTFLEREELSFRAFFTFLKIRPEFYRIMYEAELFAPAAFNYHVNVVSEGYVRLLDRAAKAGEIKVTDRSELEGITYMLMGARHYLARRFASRGEPGPSIPDWVVRNYMALVTTGLFDGNAAAAPAEPGRGQQAPLRGT